MKKDKEWLKNKVLNLRNASNRVMVVAIGEVMELIDQLDEPEKVVVPQWFDEWVKGNIFHSDDLGKILMIKNISQVGWGYTFEIGVSGEVYKPDANGNLSIYHHEIYNDQEKYIRAVLDGYEVEKEKLYRIELPSGHVFARCGDDKHFTSVDPTSVDLSQPWKFNFTEKEIKLAGEKYWIFAKEVTE